MKKQSSLIISILLRMIPIPCIYLNQDKNGIYHILDGLQRLKTFQNFYNDSLILQTDIIEELNGKRFSDINNNKYKNRLDDYTLSCFYYFDLSDKYFEYIFNILNGKDANESISSKSIW